MKQKIAVLTIATFLVLSLFFAVSAGAATEKEGLVPVRGARSGTVRWALTRMPSRCWSCTADREWPTSTSSAVAFPSPVTRTLLPGVRKVYGQLLLSWDLNPIDKQPLRHAIRPTFSPTSPATGALI